MVQRRDFPRNVAVATGGRYDGVDAGPAGERATRFLDRVPGD